MTANIKQRKPKYDLQLGQLLWCTRDFPEQEIYQVVFDKYFEYNESNEAIWARLPGTTDEYDVFILYKPHWHVTREEAILRLNEIVYAKQNALLQLHSKAVEKLFATEQGKGIERLKEIEHIKGA